MISAPPAIEHRMLLALLLVGVGVTGMCAAGDERRGEIRTTAIEAHEGPTAAGATPADGTACTRDRHGAQGDPASGQLVVRTVPTSVLPHETASFVHVFSSHAHVALTGGER